MALPVPKPASAHQQHIICTHAGGGGRLTVYPDHRARAARRELRLPYRILQVRDELVHDGHRQPRHRDVHRRGPSERIQMPALLPHLITDLEHAHALRRALAHGRERHDGCPRVAQDTQLRDLRADALCNRARRSDNRFAGLQVAPATRGEQMPMYEPRRLRTGAPCSASLPKFPQGVSLV